MPDRYRMNWDAQVIQAQIPIDPKIWRLLRGAGGADARRRGRGRGRPGRHAMRQDRGRKRERVTKHKARSRSPSTGATAAKKRRVSAHPRAESLVKAMSFRLTAVSTHQLLIRRQRHRRPRRPRRLRLLTPRAGCGLRLGFRLPLPPRRHLRKRGTSTASAADFTGIEIREGRKRCSRDTHVTTGGKSGAIESPALGDSSSQARPALLAYEMTWASL
ncbi:hypothetical protein BHE74_00038494 [Ensete ventricosum]|nr:hypothetical protein BHE74_00038494 [Ensete ventricosum]